MRVLFDGKMIDASFLRNVYVEKNKANAFDVVVDGDWLEHRVLETFPTEREAKDCVNKLAEKIIKADNDDIVDMR
ncbi:hypothetical protein F4054_23805 [Candidatus Poribacteria bacterium]|nr:hypothetical protein [Candidatus Poribacteria bacterium]MYK25279.1 hypothetical protein [Candidatus Poribacteria bacterium]